MATSVEVSVVAAGMAQQPGHDNCEPNILGLD